MLLPALLGMFAASSVNAGTISGTVRAQGKAGAEADLLCGKYDSRQFKFVERVNYADMRDFIVYIEGQVGTKAAPPAKPVQVITQRVTQRARCFNRMSCRLSARSNGRTTMKSTQRFRFGRARSIWIFTAPVVKQVTFDKPGRVDVFPFTRG
jgi:hypothetical protein